VNYQAFLILENQGSIHDYLGIKIRKTKERRIKLTQPHLIESILVFLDLLDEQGKPRDKASAQQIPSYVTKQIRPDHDGQPFSY
jgi:hypothetical protein